MTEADNILQLEGLENKHPGLTAALAATYFEAASVCLSRHHVSPVQMAVETERGVRSRVTEFVAPDIRTESAYANLIDAVEVGAYGVALAAVECEEGLVAISRTETLSGADWYLAAPDANHDDLEAAYRLEVSGTDSGDTGVIAARVKQKANQTRRGNSNLPALASVVGFKESKIVIHKVRGVV